MKRYVELFRNNIDILANHLLVLMAFWLPFSYKPVASGFSVLILLFAFKKERWSALKRAVNNRVVQAFLLYFLVNIIGILFSDDYHSSWNWAKNLSYCTYPLIMMIFLRYEYVKRIISAFIVGMFISELASYGVYFEFITHTTPFIQDFLFVKAGPAYPTPFMDHLAYGFFLALTSSTLLYLMLKTDDIRLKSIEILFFILISMNLFINIARSSYILYAIGLLFVLYRVYRSKFWKAFPFGLLALASIFIIANTFSPNFGKKIDQTVHNVEKIIYEEDYHSSIGMRIDNYILASKLIEEKPLFGYGTGQHVKALHQRAVQEKSWVAKTIEKYWTSDSQYLDVLLQFGVVGFILFLNILYQGFRYKQEDHYLRTLQLVLLILFSLYSIQTFSMYVWPVSTLFFFLLTLTLVQKSEEKSISTVSMGLMVKYALFAVALAFIS